MTGMRILIYQEYIQAFFAIGTKYVSLHLLLLLL
jgi:hypothetical protein